MVTHCQKSKTKKLPWMLEKITGFHIEPTNICTLKCAACSRTKFIEQWPSHWKNHNLNIDHLLAFLDIDLTGRRMYLCGNYGDPIYHTDFINFVSRLKQAGTVITLTTNGSHRSQEWWQQLVGLLDDQDVVRFSIDGLPENFTTYRKNADWPSILTGIKACVEGHCQTVWKYIPFAFNQQDIPQAELLAQQLGFDSFAIDPSDRFDEHTAYLFPKSHDHVGSKLLTKEQWKKESAGIAVDPQCVSGREHFISADGHYSPCCFVADHNFYYKTQFGKYQNVYDISSTTLSKLLSESAVIEFYDKLDSHAVCRFNCPKIQNVV